ncbi:MAG: hypothetical protein QOH87_1092, partial [Trebonia sp.]|nr:hypothetical protein [Trebonia sp.]
RRQHLARPGCRKSAQRRKTKVNSNLTTIIILVTVIHVAVLAVMIWIRVRPTEGDGIPVRSLKIRACALCGEPATDWSYDGLDPNEQRDSHTGKAWSADLAHYRPVCAAH